jgi:hypothetical protein
MVDARACGDWKRGPDAQGCSDVKVDELCKSAT